LSWFDHGPHSLCCSYGASWIAFLGIVNCAYILPTHPQTNGQTEKCVNQEFDANTSMFCGMRDRVTPGTNGRAWWMFCNTTIQSTSSHDTHHSLSTTVVDIPFIWEFETSCNCYHVEAVSEFVNHMKDNPQRSTGPRDLAESRMNAVWL